MRDFDEFIKTAATYKEVKRSKLVCAPERVKGFINRMAEPEGFMGATYTKIRPTILSGGNIGYNVHTKGAARHATTLDADTDFEDVIGNYYKKKGDKAYDDYISRMQPYMDKYKNSNIFTEGHYGRKMLKNMSDEDRDVLVNRRDETADLHAKNPRAAQRAVTRTTYYYYY